MTRIFTQNDLVRYFYGETTKEETKHIAQILIEDKHLQRQYDELVSIQKKLDALEMNPSSACTDRILDYARARNKSQQERLSGVES